MYFILREVLLYQVSELHPSHVQMLLLRLSACALLSPRLIMHLFLLILQRISVIIDI